MSSIWELKQCNVWVNHLKTNYKIVLKAVTHLHKQMSFTEELFCHLRVTVHRQPIDRFIGQFVISHNFAHCRTWDELFNMIIEFDTCIMRQVWCKGKVTCPPSVRGNLYLSEQQIQVFSHSAQTMHLLIGFN